MDDELSTYRASSISTRCMLDTQLIIHDSIHGSFSLPECAWLIIDTPEYQRLRSIKQTGNTCYVYPSSEHTRFQHCLGVAHLALDFGKAIKMKFPNLISDHQILLLCLAGLVHDIGHCAYSHLYDEQIIPMFNKLKSDRELDNCILSHEEASVLILESIYNKSDELQSSLRLDDIYTIGKMILGSPDKIPASLEKKIKWTPYDYEHQYLFEVVSNDKTGIDVDKFDYLKRDSHYTGIPCTFDPCRLMAFLNIEYKDGKYVIEYLRKSDELIYSMWLSRDDLHRRAYQHRVVKCIDLMTIEMIQYCADDIVCNGVCLRDAHKSLSTYVKLTDTVIISLINKNAKAKALYDRLLYRDIWPTIATIVSDTKINFNFSSPLIRTASAKFKDDYRYYIYYTGSKYKTDDPKEGIDAIFFAELILQANGGSIKLRKSSFPVQKVLSHMV